MAAELDSPEPAHVSRSSMTVVLQAAYEGLTHARDLLCHSPTDGQLQLKNGQVQLDDGLKYLAWQPLKLFTLLM